MSGSALEDLRRQAAVVYLVSEGAPTATVAELTGLGWRFVRLVGRELQQQSRLRTPERIWSSRSLVLQASVFGACVHRVTRTHGDWSATERVVASYRLFRVFRGAVVTPRDGSVRFTAKHAVHLFVSMEAGTVTLDRCGTCGAVFWRSREVAETMCPVCPADDGDGGDGGDGGDDDNLG